MLTSRRLAALCLLLLGTALGACDRDVTDPTLADDEVEALLARAGVAPAADLTLTTLLHDAIRTVQQERGTAAARTELERVRRAQLLEDPDSAARGQLAVVLDLLGEATPERALATTRERLARLESALESLADGDGAALHEARTEAVQALASGERALASGDSVGALLAGARAAESVARLRRGLVARDRIEALPELFGRARARIDSLGSPALLQRHAVLSAAASTALGRGRRMETHRALTAVRAEEIRLTLAVLGEETAGRVSADVARELVRLEPLVHGSARLERMHAAARDLAVRAQRELERGRPAASLDLASHAAGLTNALRVAVSLR